MKHAAATSMLSAMLAFSMPLAFAQDVSTPAKPLFDAELAKRTGADARGMRP